MTRADQRLAVIIIIERGRQQIGVAAMRLPQQRQDPLV